jgi:carboxypeptidase C (cathepsin A)
MKFVGHYGPIINQYVEQQNELIAKKELHNAHHINLKTLLIGNGWYDPLIQYQAYYNFTVFPGNTYDYKPFNESISAMMYNSLYGPGNCVDMTKDCYARGINSVCSFADNFCANNVEEVLDIYANRDEYDIRELSPDPFPPTFYVDYLNSPTVQEAIGAYVNFSESNGAVSSAFGSTGDDDREDGTIEALRSLVCDDITVVLYAGDADYNCKRLYSHSTVPDQS